MKYCPRCKAPVESCDHKKVLPKIVDPPKTDMDLLDLGRRLVEGRLTTEDLRRYSPSSSDEMDVGDNLVLLPFSTLVEPEETTHIVARTQINVAPTRLVYGGPKATFALCDIKLGKNSQFACAGPISMDCFPPHPKRSEPIDNLVGLPKIIVSMDMSLIVANLTKKSQIFYAVIYGRTVY
jgi:hypothetical protein